MYPLTPTPLKKLGQHFLQDPVFLRIISSSLGPLKGKNVLEIGPGTGTLTHLLLQQKPASLTLVEKDPRFLPNLKTLCQHHPLTQCSLVNDDILSFSHHPKPNSLLVGNLPYYLLTPLFLKWMTQPKTYAQYVLLVQQEFAQRLTAQPKSPHRGSLSIAVQRKMFLSTLLLSVPPQAFNPPPTVYSSLIAMKPRDIPIGAPLTEDHKLEKLTKLLFAHRRKILSNALKPLWDNNKIRTILQQETLAPNQRPSELSIEQLCALTRYL